MAHGDFVWCDLSTFRPGTTKAFYSGLFGWGYSDASQPDGSCYHIAAADAGERAGVFEMPEKFRKIGLPSFWMSYIEVDDVDAAIETAQLLGGKIELGPVPFSEPARLVLIRDPLGAGFTVCESAGLPARSPAPEPGEMAWNALYVSNASKVIDFYSALFGWQISPVPNQPGTWHARTDQGDVVSEIQQLPEAVRGKYEFWGVHFAVADHSAAKTFVTGRGGRILYEDRSSLLAEDPDGAAFFLVPADEFRHHA